LKKTLCQKCGNIFANKGGNYNKHIASCDGTYQPPQKSICCKYCFIDFSNFGTSERANHTRWCLQNPKRNSSIDNLKNARQNISTDSRKQAAQKIKQLHQEGRYNSAYEKKKGRIGNKHTEKTKKHLSEKALLSKHRRLQRNIQVYNGIMMDSSWEVELAKRLDALKIKWTRPDPLPWIDDHGITHNYFPDFYLPEYNLYLDPKNPQAERVQKHKLDCLLMQYDNIVILRTLVECKEYLPSH
jgi:hypothetical protein